MVATILKGRFLSLILLFLTLFLSNMVEAGSNPTANFTISPGAVVPQGTTVCFTDASTPHTNGSQVLTAWDWTFANQAPAFSGQNPPCVPFDTLGNYDVCLQVEDGDGDTDNQCYTIQVLPGYDMTTDNGTTVTDCGALLTDGGGYDGDYSNNQSNSVTLCSGSTDYVYFNFMQIALAAGDNITLYQGVGTGGAVLSTITSADNGTNPTIYALNTCMTIVFNTNSSGIDAGFMGQINCHPSDEYSIAAYDGQTITGCGLTFTDSGGSTGNFQNNESYSMTFCADDPNDVIQLELTNFWMGAGDTLFAYDGTSTSGDLIYTGESDDNANWGFILFIPIEGLTITGQSQCITLEFVSDGSGVNSGWNADVNCVTPPAPCNSNPIASDNFDGATLVCDLSAYCGTTSAFYGVDMNDIGQTAGVFYGSIENNSWLMFVADSTAATFDVEVTGCSSGIQIGIYEVDENENFTWMSDSIYNNNYNYTSIDYGFTGTGVLNAENLTPGETYYVMVDGFGGDVCDYSLGANIGIQVPEPVTSLTTPTCVGDPGEITVTDNNGSTNVDWEWTWDNGAGGPFTGDQIDLSTFPAGTYEFAVTADAFSDCAAASAFDTIVVFIDPCTPLPVELSDFTVECMNDKRTLSWNTISEMNNDHFVLERAHNSIDFEPIKYIDGAGNSLTPNSYSLVDNDRLQGTIYYRLRQIDFNGNQEVSNVISTNICNSDAYTVNQIYYNNVSDEIIILVSAEKPTPVNIDVTDVQGKRAISGARQINAGVSEIRVNASNLKSGSLFMIRIDSDSTTDTGRVLIAR